MSSVGSHLRSLREAHGLSLEELARATRIGSPQLASLEIDDFATLPAPVFIKGFIRAYCQALGEDPAEALNRFEQAGWSGPVPSARGAVMVPGVAREPRRNHVLVSLLLFVVLGVALATVTLALRPRRDRPDVASRPAPAAAVARTPASVATPPSPPVTDPSGPGASSLDGRASPPRPSDASSSSRAAEPSSGDGSAARRSSPPSGEARASASPSGPAAGASPSSSATMEARPPATGGPPGRPRYHLVARTSQATWVRVRTEEGQLVEETIPAGQVREWRSNAPLVLTVGNAGGITLELNGRALPSLGERGAVVRSLVVPRGNP